MTNANHTVLYTGITNDLPRRAGDHREGKTPGFTQRYAVTKLVYFELHRDALSAIEREKQIKAGSRSKKIALIESRNPEWRDLYPDLFDET
jgi:putative endonuclease